MGKHGEEKNGESTIKSISDHDSVIFFFCRQGYCHCVTLPSPRGLQEIRGRSLLPIVTCSDLQAQLSSNSQSLVYGMIADEVGNSSDPKFCF